MSETPKAPLGAATGYATATDAALDWFANPRANPHAVAKAIGHEGWPHAVSIKAGEVLAAEVRRLRAVLADINAIARLHPDESGREDFETLEVIADKSHNEVAHPRREVEGGAK